MLTASALHKKYAKKKILNGIEWHVKKGVHALIGPEEAGKSTFMRILAGCERPSKGEVMINQTSLKNQPEEYRQRIGYLPQTFKADRSLTVEQFMHYAAVLKGIRYRKKRKAEIEYCLNQVQLMPFLKFKLKSLTEGMHQRVGIAQALINEPEILIIDEPTRYLDPIERAIFRHIITEYGKNKTVLLATNKISEIQDYYRSVTVMKDGECIYKGSPQPLIGRPRVRSLTNEEAEIDHYLTLIRSSGHV
ncbi:ABC-2 type transport system ATP-binding protein [Pullulanibacillus pueri]|uniref:ABC transporter ATP-binding protein n=1 Tax=Pullulanibacillus pueri TaxID=1437324 RepID=A0A8J3EPH3_9BACL|nr:ATP-binding cassette domain-containing protein [Pullulanibacillus pueri]MBM7680550.1 ABC-2 type transport system ATP-binding protein [Pullulanibacillus pueri]GGH88401.1 ABC transporter ATP-binding protein [Pullulanibacillus pueri]